MPRPTRQRGRETQTDRRREALLDRLVDVILSEGFVELNLEDIAAALRCSKSTLYSIADSKERIIAAGVKRFFQRAAARVDAQLLRSAGPPVERIHTYLVAIAAELAPASPAFFADLDSSPAMQEIYRHNTKIASERVRELVREASPPSSRVSATFVGAVAAQVMEAIHRGEIETATGLDDSAAYQALADLIVRSLEPTATGDT